VTVGCDDVCTGTWIKSEHLNGGISRLAAGRNRHLGVADDCNEENRGHQQRVCARPEDERGLAGLRSNRPPAWFPEMVWRNNNFGVCPQLSKLLAGEHVAGARPVTSVVPRTVTNG